ncbi:hypothetical protein GCM10009814_04240 [Lapillicoccus jejuensis]|uniref:Uncharacterized protein n=2 Tax=Lapillicoccus jejuensis TaxID=402171 RepID=A0A542DYR7_9MICO|nr:hypothetical protein FB458_1311 [Lapillicoccus jejuensis]
MGGMSWFRRKPSTGPAAESSPPAEPEPVVEAVAETVAEPAPVPEPAPASVRGPVLLDAPADPFAELGDADLLAGTYSRLVPEERLSRGHLRYARPVAPGLVEVLGLDLEDAIAEYGDDQVAEYGPVEDLWRAGRSNLRRVEADDRRTLERDGGRVEVLLAESPYLASTLLVLDEVVERVTGQAPDPDLGVLAAAPNHHQLDFHVIADDSLLPSLNLIAAVGAVGHHDDAAALSPDVYWWHHGRLERLTTVHDGRIRVDATGEFGKVLEQVGGEPPTEPA